MKDNYIRLFQDREYPHFLLKYLDTKTMKRLKDVNYFCGADYTKLYSPLFLYSRFDHSLVVAHMTWHFTHDKKETVAALLHDVGTPAFAHIIDYVLGDYVNQETSEVSIVEVIKQDEGLIKCLEEDNLSLHDFTDLAKYPILENKSPKLCTDRLDGVFSTCFIWLHTHKWDEVKEVYDSIVILENEEGNKELGFKDEIFALKFVSMVFNYAREFLGNRDKYLMQYITDAIKILFQKKLILHQDLYLKKEQEIVEILEKNIRSWDIFCHATDIYGSDAKPNSYYVSIDTKRRNVIPLVIFNDEVKRIDKVNIEAHNIYLEYQNYKDYKYGYIEEIKNID